MALSVNMLCKDNDAKTFMLKTDQGNQYLCLPCNVHVNAIDAVNHPTSDKHRKATAAMNKIDDKLAQLGLTRKDVAEAAQGTQVKVPLVRRMDELDLKAQTYFFRIDQMEQKINGVADDMLVEAHYGHVANKQIQRVRTEKATKRQIGDMMKEQEQLEDRMEKVESWRAEENPPKRANEMNGEDFDMLFPVSTMKAPKQMTGDDFDFLFPSFPTPHFI